MQLTTNIMAEVEAPADAAQAEFDLSVGAARLADTDVTLGLLSKAIKLQMR